MNILSFFFQNRVEFYRIKKTLSIFCFTRKIFCESVICNCILIIPQRSDSSLLEGQSFILQLHNQNVSKFVWKVSFRAWIVLRVSICISLLHFRTDFWHFRKYSLWLIAWICMKVPFSCLKLHCVIKISRIIHFKQVFVHLRQHSFFLCLNSDTIEGSFFIEGKTKSKSLQYIVILISFLLHYFVIKVSQFFAFLLHEKDSPICRMQLSWK